MSNTVPTTQVQELSTLAAVNPSALCKSATDIASTALLITRGQEAWACLNRDNTWRNWKPVGNALAFGRAQAKATAHAKKPVGRRYNTLFSDWLARNGFAGISKSTRAHLLTCMENLEAIEEWRSTLEPDDLIKFNHPTTVLRGWRASLRKQEAGDSRDSNEDTPPAASLGEAKRLIERLAAADRDTLVGELLRGRPDLVPDDLRERLLRQDHHHRHHRDARVDERIIERLKAITAFCNRPEQHRDAILKALAEIRHAVERPKAPTAATPQTPVGDLTAWSKAMEIDTSIPDFLLRH